MSVRRYRDRGRLAELRSNPRRKPGPPGSDSLALTRRFPCGGSNGHSLAGIPCSGKAWTSNQPTRVAIPPRGVRMGIVVGHYAPPGGSGGAARVGTAHYAIVPSSSRTFTLASDGAASANSSRHASCLRRGAYILPAPTGPGRRRGARRHRERSRSPAGVRRSVGRDLVRPDSAPWLVRPETDPPDRPQRSELRQLAGRPSKQSLALGVGQPNLAELPARHRR